MKFSRPGGRVKSTPRAETAPERRSERRNEAPSVSEKAFYRARLSFTKSDFVEPDFVPGYN